MAINLGGTGLNLGTQPTPAAPMNVSNEQPGLTLNLQKNQLLDLTKREPGLTKVTLGAGWDVAQMGQSFDLDIAAFLLDANGKVTALENVIFFNNKVAPGIQLMGDNRTGAGEGDDEQIEMDLTQINPAIQRIVFVVTIHEAVAKRQTFGMVQNSYVRLVNPLKGDQEICRFNLKEEGSTGTSVIFAELDRSSGDWQFKALGESKAADLNQVLALYL